jgi:hypothetical protein
MGFTCRLRLRGITENGIFVGRNKLGNVLLLLTRTNSRRQSLGNMIFPYYPVDNTNLAMDLVGNHEPSPFLSVPRAQVVPDSCV